MAEPEIAFVIDALPGLGGSERVLMAALESFPSAPVYTLIYNRAAFADTLLVERDVRVSWVDRLPRASAQYRSYLPILPFAIRTLDLHRYDTIVSFHYAVAHGIRPAVGQTHLSYVFTPLRYAWRGSVPKLPRLFGTRWVASVVFGAIRAWDRRVAGSVTSYAAVSAWAAGNVRRAFGREARVIYPPVDLARFHPGATRADYFLIVSRLVHHKRVDLVVDAFSRLGLPLLVVGDGPERAALECAAGPNVRFLAHKSDRDVASLMEHARAFVHAGEEDFGIALLEAQAAGCPVIAYGGGAVSETITDGLHGILFPEQTVECVIEAVKRFEAWASCAISDPLRGQGQADGGRLSRSCGANYRISELRANAARFRTERFQQAFSSWVEEERK